ncbi:DUF2341 domain-containing protein [Patescibacteria group bacterium]|nr:DUF2341 domain-containing protein [Patescibacteria group bacterium]
MNLIRNITKRLPILLAVFLIASLVVSLFPQRAEAAWYDTDWAYKKQKVVDQTDDLGAVNYPMKITLHYGGADIDDVTGAQATAIIHMPNASVADFDDVRFTNSAENTLLDYWIENKTDGVSAIVWVEVPLLAGAADTTIYLYYGNAAAPAVSSGANTFSFFNHFDADAANLAAFLVAYPTWEQVGSPTVVVASSIVTVTGVDAAYEQINGVTNYGTSALRAKAILEPGGGKYTAMGYGEDLNATVASARFEMEGADDVITRDGAHQETTTQNLITRNGWDIYDIFYIKSTSAQYFYANGTSIVTHNTHPPTVDLPLVIGTYKNSVPTQIQVDWVLVRAYTATEPTWGSFGSEESVPPPFVPPTVVTGVCSGFTDSTAVLNGMVTANGAAVPTQYGFEYGLTTSYGIQYLVTATPTLGINYWANLTGLSPATVYHYRAIALNGAQGNGVDAVFSTKGSPARYEYLDSGSDNNSAAIYGNTWGYQQFTVTNPLTSDNISHTVTSINVYIKRVSAATPLVGTVTLSLKHAAGGKPTGNDLVVTTFDGNAISTGYTMYHFDTDAAGLPINVNLEGGQQYAIVIAAKTGDASNYILWGVDNGGGLADAIYGTSTDGGLIFVADASKDALFEIWGNPCIEVLSTKVFTGYKQADDWLIVADVNNIYVPYYPDNDSQLYFQLQLISDNITKGATNFRAWGRQPLAIYLNAGTASALSWGDTTCKIRIQALFNNDVLSEYALVPADWSAGSLLYLDSYARTLASTYETYYSTAYLISSAGQTVKVLNEAGSIIFMRGIPGLEIVRPNLFYTSFGIAKPGVTSHTLLVPDPAAALGVDAYGRVMEAANLVGVDAETIIGWVLLGLALFIGIGCVGVGHGIAGLIIGLFFAGGAGFVFGGIPIAIIGAIGFVFLMLVVLWLAKMLFQSS